jgi:hypothetical protein
MKFYVLTFFVVFSLFFELKAQESDSINVLIYVVPNSQYRVKINNELMPPSHKFKLLPGSYDLQLWSANYHVKDTSIVVGNMPIVLKTSLKKTNELYLYEKEYNKYRSLKGKTPTLGIISLVCFSGTYLTYRLYNNNNLEFVKNKNGIDYKVIGYYDEDFEKANRNLKVSKTFLVGTVALSTVFSVLTINAFFKFNKMEVPILPKDDSFIVNDLGYYYNPFDQTNNFKISFSIK